MSIRGVISRHRRAREGARSRQLGVLRARKLMDLAGLRLAPALASALIVFSRDGAGDALLIFAAMFAALQLVEYSRFPPQLMPASRVLMGFVAPALGGLTAVAVTALAGQALALGSVVPAVIGATLVLALGAWLKVRVEASACARVAVIGSPRFAADLRAEMRAAGIHAYELAGWLGPEGPYGADADAPPWLGSLDQLRGAVLVNHIDLIVVTASREGGFGTGSGPWERVAASCLDLPLRMMDANQFYEELLGHIPMGTIDQAWYRYVLHPRFHTADPVSKRVLDKVMVSVIGLLTLPLVLLGALAVKLGDRGPVLYRQRRLGEHGEPFEILKLRTMTVDAEADGVARWSEAGDVRVTPVGRFLRRTHIDELPQLWNVLRGDMTFVGPRPERPEMVARLEGRYSHYTRRHLLKPGIAGWAQVRCGYGGSDAAIAWKLSHDLFYIKHRSLLTDALITFETAFVIFLDAHRELRAPLERFMYEERANG